MQLASNAILNAIWDLWAKVEDKPLWKLVVDFTPEQLISVIDFRYITDALTPEEALIMLKETDKTKSEKVKLALRNKVGCVLNSCNRPAHPLQAVPGYNTSVGWLGLSDATVEDGLRKAADAGFKHFKLKVGLGIENDRKRLGMVRKVVGEDAVTMTDVNQLWDVDVSLCCCRLSVGSHQAARFDIGYSTRSNTCPNSLISTFGSSKNPPLQTTFWVTRVSAKP